MSTRIWIFLSTSFENKVSESGLGAWPSFGQIVKIWQQSLCLTFFDYFENLAEFWPNLHVISHSGIKTYKMSKERSLKVVWFNDHKVAEYCSRLA